MGKHLKTSMDEKVIAYLAIELYKKDPLNTTLNKFMSMKNEEGYTLTKIINKFKDTGEYPDHYNTDGTWKYPGGKISFEEFAKT
jgi:hypothetical protein|tara:strand:+ start:870 stop:1121 length:252 start_codon:yes stop_codon:yes gene_type:complete